MRRLGGGVAMLSLFWCWCVSERGVGWGGVVCCEGWVRRGER